MNKGLCTITKALTAGALLFSAHLQAQNSSPYWSLAGNSNASTSSKLGTTNGIPLRLFTNNLERMRIDASTGKVAIGATAPIGRLHVTNGGSTPASTWASPNALFTGFGQSTGGSGDLVVGVASASTTIRPVFAMRRSRGTLGAPTPVLNNDMLGSFLASGYDGSAFQTPVTIDFYADGAPSSGNVPGRISFVTGTNVGNRQERLTVKSNGNVGIGTTSPSNKLHVIGRGRFSDGLTVEESGIYSVHTTGNGVEGYGNTDYGIGVLGNGYYGLYGTGTTFGAYTTGGYYGVYTSGSSYGVVGSSSYIGTYGSGSSFGLYGYSSNGKGIYAQSSGNSTEEGYAGQFISDNYRGIIVTSASGWYAGYFNGDVYATGSFISSDARLKKNVKDVENAMDIINKLQPKHYEFKNDGNYAKLNLPKGNHFGLLAQDVEKVLPNLVRAADVNTKNITAATSKGIKNGKVAETDDAVKGENIEFKSVNYTELIPVLVKAMQEQQQEIENLKDQLNRLTKGQGAGAPLSSASMSQNMPNPVKGNTSISYVLPNGTRNARLLVTDNLGRTIKAVPLTESGTIQLNTSTLSSGVYNYSLVIDNQTVSTRKLTVVR